MTTNLLSRETSPHTDQILTGTPPSRETGPHPNNSLKKLAQALKKRAQYETKRHTQTSQLNQSRDALPKALKATVNAPHPDPSTKELAKTLKYYAERRIEQPNPSIKTLTNVLTRSTKKNDERPTRTYVERIRELLGSPERCKECGKEHSTRLCMKRFEKL